LLNVLSATFHADHFCGLVHAAIQGAVFCKCEMAEHCVEGEGRAALYGTQSCTGLPRSVFLVISLTKE